MKKIFLIFLFAFMSSCSVRTDDVDDLCLSRTCAFDLLDNLSFAGMGIGTVQPNIQYFMSTRTSPASMSDIKYMVQTSLGLRRYQVNALVGVLSDNPNLVLSFIEDNRSALEKLLYFADWRERSLFFHESLGYWFKNSNSELSQDFELFYQEYGHLDRFPYKWSGMSPEDEDFHDDMDDIIEKYPYLLFDDGRNGYVPEKYKSWLFFRRWKERVGAANLTNLLTATESILSH